MARETYSFEIVAEIAKARQSIEKFAKDSQSSLDSLNISSSVTAIASGFSLISNTAGAAFSKISAFVGESINESIEAEKSLKQLSNAMRLVGDFSDEALSSFKEFAGQLAQTTTLTDGQVIAAAALAKSYSLTNKETKNVINAAKDLSAVTGDSLIVSVEKLTKSYNGFIDKGIKQLIPQLNTLTKSQLANGEAVDIVAAKFSGSAAELNNTFGGALSNLTKQIDSFKEGFGNIITQNPEFISGIKSATDSVIFFTANLGKFITVSKFIANISFGNIAGAVNNVVDSIKALNEVKIEDTLSKLEKLKLASVGPNKEEAIRAARELNIARAAALDEFNAIRKGLESAGLSEIQKLEKDSADKIKIIRAAINTGALENTTKIQNQIFFLQQDTAKKVQKEQERILKESLDKQRALKEADLKRNKEIFDSPLRALVDGNVKSKNDVAAAASGFTTQILKGAEGAKKLVVEGGAIALQAFAGIPEKISGPLLEALSAGPDVIRQQVKEFANALPLLIQNIILAIPVLIEELAKAVPQIVKGIVDAIPEIINGLVQAIPGVAAALSAQMPLVAIELSLGIIRNIPKIVEGFATEFLKIPEKFAKKLLSAIPGGGGILGIGGGGDDGKKKGLLGLGFLGLADGGRVPDSPKFEGDRALVRLDRGEQVFSGDLTNKLESFLSGESRPQNMTVVLQVGQQELSRTILELNRGGFRLA